ncbi:MAG TPA: glycoside hydrolase family 16 protein, partial [Actinomycetota bacterium]|nr:glycoside hydrolase family 16 protein [Actinomycetota bacterium]
GGDPGGWWDPSHVVVSGGMLQLQCYVDPAHANPANMNGYVCGGVGSGGALVQTYGQYDVRFRVDKGDGIGYAALLWPSYTSWPPEIDFAEDGGGDRSGTTATWHCGSNGDDSCQEQANLTIDVSRWHTLGVQWTPTSLVYTIDGATWATMTGPGIPNVAMEMDLQMQAGACGDPYTPCPDATTPSNVNMDVDWVVAYKPAP